MHILNIAKYKIFHILQDLKQGDSFSRQKIDVASFNKFNGKM